MKKFMIPLSLAVVALLGAEARADQPFNGTLNVTLANPIGDTFPYRASGSFAGIGEVTARGWFVWDKDAGAVTNALLIVKDSDEDVIVIGFGGFVSEAGQFQAAGFEVFGGTGKWEGATGIGTINGSVVAPAQFNLRGTIFD